MYRQWNYSFGRCRQELALPLVFFKAITKRSLFRRCSHFPKQCRRCFHRFFPICSPNTVSVTGCLLSFSKVHCRPGICNGITFQMTRTSCLLGLEGHHQDHGSSKMPVHLLKASDDGNRLFPVTTNPANLPSTSRYFSQHPMQPVEETSSIHMFSNAIILLTCLNHFVLKRRVISIDQERAFHSLPGSCHTFRPTKEWIEFCCC